MGSESPTSREDVFQVAVRFRPLNARERGVTAAARDSDDDEDEDDESGDLLQIFSERTFTFDEKAYTFDRVFDQTVDQTQLYRTMIEPLVARFVGQPHDVTIIAYGQTSSGKTHTIDGGGEVAEPGSALPADTGLLPRTIFDVFALLASAGSSARVEFSFYEIYCEKIVDLLAATANSPDVQLFDDRKTGKVFMKNLTWERARSAGQLIGRLQETRSKRHYAHTEMNANSSRSHTIFDLRLTAAARGPHGTGPIAYKNLRIVDLAGSERAARTKAVGVTFEEGKKINQSLMDLRSIIAQLSRRTGGASGGKNNPSVVNHRASKLTRILYGSFKGRSRVVVLVCCSPAPDSRHETTGSLRFGCYAKKISLKLDDMKAAQPRTTLSTTTPDPATVELTARMARMADEAADRERKIAEYETEMESLRRVLQSFERRAEAVAVGTDSEEAAAAVADEDGTRSRDTTHAEEEEEDTRREHRGTQTAVAEVATPPPPFGIPDESSAWAPLSAHSQPAPLIDDSLTHDVQKLSTQLEKERRRCARYRATIKDLRRSLDDKIYDNEQLEQELNAMRTLKNMLLQEL